MKIKNFLSLIFLMLCVAFVPDLSGQTLTKAISNSGATVTNAATVNLTYRKYGAPIALSFHLVNTKVSGTVAGTSYLESSNDNVNFITLDSLVNTNVTTNQKIFRLTPPGEAFYRIRNVGSGTMVYTSVCVATASIPK